MDDLNTGYLVPSGQLMQDNSAMLIVSIRPGSGEVEVQDYLCQNASRANHTQRSSYVLQANRTHQYFFIVDWTTSLAKAAAGWAKLVSASISDNQPWSIAVAETSAKVLEFYANREWFERKTELDALADRFHELTA